MSDLLLIVFLLALALLLAREWRLYRRMRRASDRLNARIRGDIDIQVPLGFNRVGAKETPAALTRPGVRATGAHSHDRTTR